MVRCLAADSNTYSNTYIAHSMPRHSTASQSRLFAVDVETGVLRVLFNEAAS